MARWGWRQVLGALVVLGVAGTTAELLLLEHHDGWQQVIPLVLFGTTLLAFAVHGIMGSRSTVLGIRMLMASFVVAGVAGVVLHYRGNAEFELEMEPALAGWPLFVAAMMGATPALAPGAMAHLGLAGLLWTWRHPVLAGVADTETTRHGQDS